jgi:hypothetical protein
LFEGGADADLISCHGDQLVRGGPIRESDNFVSQRLRRAGITASTAISVLSIGALASGAPASAAPQVPAGCSLSARVVTCTYTAGNAEQTFVVPAGVSAIDVDAVGGHGGDLPIYRGGAAGHVSVTALAVTP